MDLEWVISVAPCSMEQEKGNTTQLAGWDSCKICNIDRIAIGIDRIAVKSASSETSPNGGGKNQSLVLQDPVM